MTNRDGAPLAVSVIARSWASSSFAHHPACLCHGSGEASEERRLKVVSGRDGRADRRSTSGSQPQPLPGCTSSRPVDARSRQHRRRRPRRRRRRPPEPASSDRHAVRAPSATACDSITRAPMKRPPSMIPNSSATRTRGRQRELDQRRTALMSVRGAAGEPDAHASQYMPPASALCLETVSYFTAPSVGISGRRAHAGAEHGRSAAAKPAMHDARRLI